MDRGTWQVMVHRVSKSWTQLSMHNLTVNTRQTELISLTPPTQYFHILADDLTISKPPELEANPGLLTKASPCLANSFPHFLSYCQQELLAVGTNSFHQQHVGTQKLEGQNKVVYYYFSNVANILNFYNGKTKPQTLRVELNYVFILEFKQVQIYI